VNRRRELTMMMYQKSPLLEATLPVMFYKAEEKGFPSTKGIVASGK
jgi:hypothetical protein